MTFVAFTSVASTVLPEIVPFVVVIFPPAVISVPALIVVVEVTVFPFKSPENVPSLPDTSPEKVASLPDKSPVNVPSLPDKSPVVLISPRAERPCINEALPVAVSPPVNVLVPATVRPPVYVPVPAVILPSFVTSMALFNAVASSELPIITSCPNRLWDSTAASAACPPPMDRVAATASTDNSFMPLLLPTELPELFV